MIPELKTMSKSGMLPYHMEGVEYYTVVEDFVRSWLTKAGDVATDQYAQAFYEEIRGLQMNSRYHLCLYQLLYMQSFHSAVHSKR